MMTTITTELQNYKFLSLLEIICKLKIGDFDDIYYELEWQLDQQQEQDYWDEQCHNDMMHDRYK